jgi:hypothetical protein
MTQLTIYGICLALTIALMAVGTQRKGADFLLPLILIPPVLAAFLTRDPANLFAPNGSRIRPFTKVLTVIIALLLVPLLAGGLYGTYRAARWLIATEVAARTGPVAVQAGPLLTVNTGLWLLSAVVVVLLLVHLRQSWKWILRMNNAGILFGYFIPLVLHGLAFFVLAATRDHLLNGPGAGAFPGFGLAAAAVGCANLEVFTQVRNLLGYKTLLGKVQVRADLTLKLFRVLSLLHAVFFGYFLVRVFFLL